MMASRRECNLQWFETALSSVRDGIVATDAEAQVVLMNPAAERLTGWSLAEARGKPVADVLVVEGAARETVEHLTDQFECCSDVRNIGRTVLRDRGGTEVHIEDSAAPMCSKDGELLGFVIVFRDVTERFRQEQEKAHLVEKLTQASQAKDDFLAMLSHELRNPLAPLVTTMQLLKLKAGDRLARECIVLERQLHHVLRLVDDLMEGSRMSRGKVQISRQPLDLAEVVSEATEMVSPLLQERRQTLDVSMAQELLVLGDPCRLTQVLANLLRNAAKYSEKGSGVTLMGAREGPEVVLTVRDHGIGVEKDRLAAIFEPFVQAPQAPDRAAGGLGLGLYIARVLVELHGGTIAVCSDGPGTGSAFTVRLPALEAASDPIRPGEQVAVEPSSVPRVLIVDDNADAAETLADALAMLGYATVTALDGPQALALVPTMRPSIALLDIGLPGMDGYELAQRLRSIDGADRLGLVALTGYGLAADRERALASGFDEHLVKPASLDVIQEVIERLCSAPSIRTASRR